MRSSLALTSLIISSACATFACSKDEAKETPVARAHVEEQTLGTVNVTVTFPGAPNDGVKGTTDSLHVIVLQPEFNVGAANCADLQGGKLDPYSTDLAQTGDVVEKTNFDAPISVPDVASGRSLVYVEAVDYSGNVNWAGCIEVNVGGGAVPANVPLERYGIYDCTDPNTKDGAPCDDGLLCKIGEKCQGGVCQPGIDRDCTGLTDQCNAGQCNETDGCVAIPHPNGTTCDDGDLCTNGDSCTGGTCTGTSLDCATQAGPCETNGVCNPYTGYCSFDYAAYGDPCDDGDFCTANDYCTSYGYCTYSGTTSCSNLTNYCGSGYCDSALGACRVSPYYSPGTSCNDSNSCTTGETCDVNGQCGGGNPAVAPVGECYEPICDPVNGFYSSTTKPCTTPTDYLPVGYTCETYYGYSPTCNGAGTCRCYP